MSRPHLLIFGLGYSARALAEVALRSGWQVTGTSRRPELVPPEGVQLVPTAAAAGLLGEATHWLASAPPDEQGDPILARFADVMRSQRPAWIGYFSTTGVYGDRQGGWVDETTAPAPTGPRGQRRVQAEQDWARLAAQCGCPIDLLRLAGIYGPGRSVLDALRAGESRRILAPGHRFGRIHRDDIAGATLAAMQCPADRPVSCRVLNLTDDEPAESAEVIAYAARLLGLELPPAVPLSAALAAMSPMGRSFWAENRQVASRITQRLLGRSWLYPSYREGLAAIVKQGG